MVLGARFLELLVALSSLAVLATSPVLFGFPEADPAATRLPWTQGSFGAVPPLFHGTAALLGSTGDLILAAGPVLRSFRRVEGRWSATCLCEIGSKSARFCRCFKIFPTLYVKLFDII